MLDEKAKQVIEELLLSGKTVEIAIRNGNIIVWETRSKKKYEATVALR